MGVRCIASQERYVFGARVSTAQTSGAKIPMVLLSKLGTKSGNTYVLTGRDKSDQPGSDELYCLYSKQATKDKKETNNVRRLI